MKYIILVGDGMADNPLEALGNKTPLEAAKTVNMDTIARCGVLGRVKTIPDKMAPASDVANMSILGYDPEKYYTGRGPLEAANLGIELGENDIAFRCNFITANNDALGDYSAGHITTKEAGILIDFLNQKLASAEIKFYCGVSYRNLLVIKNAPPELLNIQCFPPHDIIGKKISRHMPKGKATELLLSLMQESLKILPSHEINQVRIDLGENPANMIWLWGQGKKPSMPTYKEKYNLTGSVISAVDLIKGLGKILGLEVIKVPGATGFYNTDYEGKAKAAIKSLENKEFVFLHVEAPDEAGHNGDLREKLTAIERFDHFVVGKILTAFKRKKNFRILVLPDHPTPVLVRTHTSEAVPFGILGEGIYGQGFLGFNEKEAEKSKLFFNKGCELIDYFFKLER
ncbi:MAG: cofactor-independent phosphoglycerate mutase [Candidatus Omnitrophica bacterium]|nr:cofactor-independent phosphoglycerate mutase [Candidatus Omnitrophota bacterium]MBU1871452.1 cofactor-independent phosphoglycerate mutase [Candidatus Omnitrophota bacterium]